MVRVSSVVFLMRISTGMGSSLPTNSRAFSEKSLVGRFASTRARITCASWFVDPVSACTLNESMTAKTATGYLFIPRPACSGKRLRGQARIVSLDAVKPLDGIRVVDLSRILAGPYCSMLLSDFGAEIVKIENPDKGDDTRAYGPPFLDGESVYFLSINRGKKSLTLNLKTPEGREVLTKLIRQSDVFLENFRRDFLASIGFGYDEVAKLNPKIIYASV